MTNCSTIGLLQLHVVIHMGQNHHDGEQGMYWHKPNKELISFKMKLNLFNTVNNEECGHGQPCLHHLDVLSTAFFWRPLDHSFTPIPPALFFH